MSAAPEKLQVSPQTEADQRRASDPMLSAWVSANAGAGKTKVLSDRVMRLLLAGVKPAKILCLTFTKAAAANMAVRVFDQLGRWVTLDDAALIAAITKLEGAPPGRDKLTRARRLFARAVETPGGLKIETIHAFCERVLHIAPFEANVPASFQVLDEAQAADMLGEATREVLTLAASGDDPGLAAMLTRVAIETSDQGLREAIASALRDRETLRRALADPAALAAAYAGLAAAEGLTPVETEDSIAADMLHGGIPPAYWPAVAAGLRRGSATDASLGDHLTRAIQSGEAGSALDHYLAVFFTATGGPRRSRGKAERSFLTKAADPALAERLWIEQERLIGLSGKRLTAAAMARTRALLTLAAAIHGRVEAWKRATGSLDFEDLIERTATLLARPSAAWVLYKLDAGIDHLLVDEAQDTSPAQWAILKALTAEFRAGLGRREAGTRPATIFAVGDPKQSIYGFQGAAPQEFEETGRTLRREVVDAEGRFETVSLVQSFRSGPSVLTAVDAVFADPAHYDGLSFVADVVGTVHVSARPHAPGEVELWPSILPADRTDPDAWSLPLDEPEAGAPAVRNAARIAKACARWIAAGVLPGEILILARKRGPAFAATIRALKTEGVPVAGADRIDLIGHIAVKDLMAAGNAALLPQDDLTLASVLKSPLVGWSDDDLIRIAAPRPDGMTLEAAIRLGAEVGDEMARLAADTLDAWRTLAARHGPFAFYGAILGPRRGREALIARLGPEAGDAIDTFLAQAFAYERAHTPSLFGFLNAIGQTRQSVKREMEAQTPEVRVMTVHGAKGLEASVVVLIDGGEKPDARHDPPLMKARLPDGRALPVWSPRKDLDPPAVTKARETLRIENLREHNRLLYVGMTRAKDRLVVAPFGSSPPREAWGEMIRASLSGSDPKSRVRTDPGLGAEIVVWSAAEPGEGAATLVSGPPPPATTIALQSWVEEPVASDLEPPPPLRPSSALGAADAAPRVGDGPFSAEARLLGTVVHALIERLPAIPPDRRDEVARAYAAARLGRLAPGFGARAVAQALAVIDDPRLSPLFGEAARAEVPVSGSLVPPGGPEPFAVSGQIDRLAVLPDAVWLADFKTTAKAPSEVADVPPDHVVQVAVYASLLETMFPGRRVFAYLVYTASGTIHEVGPEMRQRAMAAMRPAR